MNLQPAEKEQMLSFAKQNYKHSDKLMQTLDSLNKKLGKNSIFIAAQEVNQSWQS